MPEYGLGASLLVAEVRADSDNSDDAAAFRAGQNLIVVQVTDVLADCVRVCMREDDRARAELDGSISKTQPIDRRLIFWWTSWPEGRIERA